jgi:hypothetical protein
LKGQERKTGVNAPKEDDKTMSSIVLTRVKVEEKLNAA